jgi:hypothetical protein
MLLSGCAKRALDREFAAPASAGQDDLAALEQQLTAREAQLRATGVAVAVAEEESDPRAKKAVGEAQSPEPVAPSASPPESGPTSAGADATSDAGIARTEKTEAGGGRCLQVCEISAAICGLQDQICGLVPRHREDPRYQAACDRATADCRLSTEACHGCSDT